MVPIDQAPGELFMLVGEKPPWVPQGWKVMGFLFLNKTQTITTRGESSLSPATSIDCYYDFHCILCYLILLCLLFRSLLDHKVHWPVISQCSLSHRVVVRIKWGGGRGTVLTLGVSFVLWKGIPNPLNDPIERLCHHIPNSVFFKTDISKGSWFTCDSLFEAMHYSSNITQLYPSQRQTVFFVR